MSILPIDCSPRLSTEVKQRNSTYQPKLQDDDTVSEHSTEDQSQIGVIKEEDEEMVDNDRDSVEEIKEIEKIKLIKH